MKIYTHDYTLPSQAENLLSEAYLKLRWDNYQGAATMLEQSIEKLRKYLSQDNMVEDDDAEGWVRLTDLLTEDGDDCKLI